MKTNLQEAEALLEIPVTATYFTSKAADRFHAMGISYVLITLGKRARFYSAGGRQLLQSAYPANPSTRTAAATLSARRRSSAFSAGTARAAFCKTRWPPRRSRRKSAQAVSPDIQPCRHSEIDRRNEEAMHESVLFIVSQEVRRRSAITGRWSRWNRPLFPTACLTRRTWKRLCAWSRIVRVTRRRSRDRRDPRRRSDRRDQQETRSNISEKAALQSSKRAAGICPCCCPKAPSGATTVAATMIAAAYGGHQSVCDRRHRRRAPRRGDHHGHFRGS